MAAEQMMLLNIATTGSRSMLLSSTEATLLQAWRQLPPAVQTLVLEFCTEEAQTERFSDAHQADHRRRQVAVMDALGV